MALIKIPSEDVTLRERAEVTAFLATHGIEYEEWTPEHPVGPDASPDLVEGQDLQTEQHRREQR